MNVFTHVRTKRQRSKRAMQSIVKSGAIAAVLGSCLIASTQAHQPWVLTDPGHTEAGTSVRVLPFFGHAFPTDEAMHPDRIAELIVLSADTERSEVDREAMTAPALPAGVHVVGLRQARGYWSQTTEGGRPLPRSELDNAVSCGYSDNGAKTVLIVGDGQASAAGQALGHRLEILTDADLTRLSEGHSLRFLVLLEGEPHGGPLMAFHAESGEDPFLVTETDGDGQADIVLEGPGPWMLLAHGEIDYPDPAVCDVERFAASFSFGSSDTR